jgi:hypothetical protein
MKKNCAPKDANTQPHSNNFHVQRQRIMNALKEAGDDGLTTIQLREDFDVMAPAPRVFELRWTHGYNIHLTWIRDSNAQGHEHHCGRYILLSGLWNGERS